MDHSRFYNRDKKSKQQNSDGKHGKSAQYESSEENKDDTSKDEKKALRDPFDVKVPEEKGTPTRNNLKVNNFMLEDTDTKENIQQSEKQESKSEVKSANANGALKGSNKRTQKFMKKASQPEKSGADLHSENIGGSVQSNENYMERSEASMESSQRGNMARTQSRSLVATDNEKEEKTNLNKAALVRKQRHRRRRRGHKKGDKRPIHYPRSVQVFEEQQKIRRERMSAIKSKWESKRENIMIEEVADEGSNTRVRANTWMTKLTGRPPFMHYGTKNTRPSIGGLFYGNYMVSHNKAPEAPPNIPQAPQVYPVVRKCIDKPKMLQKYLQSSRQLTDRLAVARQRKAIAAGKNNRELKQNRATSNLHSNFTPMLTIGDMRMVHGVPLEEGENFN